MESEEMLPGWEDHFYEEWRDRKNFSEEVEEHEDSEMEMRNL